MTKIDRFIERVERVLGPQVANISEEDSELSTHNLSQEDFPVPGLLFVTFQEILGLQPYGPAEKLAWAFKFLFQGAQIWISLGKFGLSLSCSKKLEVSRIVSALSKCCKISEQYLRPVISDQLDAANVTLENQYHRFDGAYCFFRESANSAYNSTPPDPVVRKTSYGTSSSSRPFQPLIHGGYLASAMLDAYFSRLEHTLVLMAPFTAIDLKKSELLRFVGSNWGDKFRRLFHLAADHVAKTIYDDLFHVKEHFRNKSAHGGFLKKGESFYFHSPAGAMPVQLTKHDSAFEFHITPVPSSTFAEICEVLDKSDEFLETSALSDAYTYVRSGLPVAVDDVSRSKYHAAIDNGNFASFLNRTAQAYDRQMNLDY